MANLNYRGLITLVAQIKDYVTKKINDVFIDVKHGGTGKESHTTNAVLVGNNKDAVKNIAASKGAFFADTKNGEPKFSTLPISCGGTGATTAAEARSNLGLGSVVTQDTVPVSKGGTGATTAKNARKNLGLGSVATEDIVPVSKGGTGASNSVTARYYLGMENRSVFLALKNMGDGTFRASTSVVFEAPSTIVESLKADGGNLFCTTFSSIADCDFNGVICKTEDSQNGYEVTVKVSAYLPSSIVGINTFNCYVNVLCLWNIGIG